MAQCHGSISTSALQAHDPHSMTSYTEKGQQFPISPSLQTIHPNLQAMMLREVNELAQ